MVDSTDLIPARVDRSASSAGVVVPCRTEGGPQKSIKRYVRGLYVFIFGRPSMQSIDDIILNLALSAKGFANYHSCDPKDTGEEIFLKLLSKHDPRLCIDVGANKGNYSEALLNFTNCKVIAFEPQPKTFEILSKLQTRFPNRFTPVNKGVGDQDTELDLHFGDGDSTLASFSQDVNEIDYVGQVNTKTTKVEVTTLDSYFKDLNGPESLDIDLLKIDTEGYEYEVLIGARQTIEIRKPKFIQIEYNWHQLFRGQSLFKMASLLPNYITYQLLPHGSGLSKVDVRRPEANIYHYSNFVFVRRDIAV